MVVDGAEIAADQGEQVAWLWMRILPNGKMPTAAGDIAGLDAIAIAEQNRGLDFIGLNPQRVARQDIRAIKEIGDAAKAFGLALRAIGRAGPKQAHELAIGRRVEHGRRFQHKRARRRGLKGQALWRRETGGGIEGRAVDGQGQHVELVAIQQQRCPGTALRVGSDRQAGSHTGFVPVQAHVEFDSVYEIIGRTIVGEADRQCRLGAHGETSDRGFPQHSAAQSAMPE